MIVYLENFQRNSTANHSNVPRDERTARDIASESTSGCTSGMLNSIADATCSAIAFVVVDSIGQRNIIQSSGSWCLIA